MFIYASRRTRLTLFAISLAFGASNQVARAQEGGSTADLANMSLEELMNIRVKTASMRQQTVTETPATSLVITRIQIQERGYTHLGDILRDLPSVDSYGNFSESFASQFTIRGHAGNNRFVILKNGVRVNPVTGELISVDENYPLYRIKQVEVIYGPASALYGADAFAGIINLVADEDFGRDNDVTVGGGNYGAQNYSGSVGHNFERSGFQFNVGGHFRTARNADLSRAYPNDVAMGPLLDPATGDILISNRNDVFSDKTSSHSFEANVKFKDRFIAGYGETRYNQLTANGQRSEFNVYGPKLEYRMRLAHGEYSAQWSPRVKGTTQFAYSVSELLPDSGYDNFYTNYTRTYKYARNRAASLNQNFMFDLTKHHVIGGISYVDIHSRPETSDLPRRLDTSRRPEEQGLDYPIDSGLPMQFYKADYGNAGAFVQVQSQWADGFSSTLGVRYDRDGRFGGTVNPRLGLVKRAGANRTVKLLYGEAFRSPTTVEMYGHFGSFVDTDPVTGKPHSYFFHVPNPSLEPEKLRMVELAYIDLIAPEIAFSSSIYYSRASSLIVDDGEVPSPGEFAGGVVDLLQRSANRGRLVTYGGDANFNFKFRIANYDVDPWVNYSYSHGKLHDPSVGLSATELRYITPHKGKAGLRLRRGPYSFVTIARASGQSTHARIDPLNSRKRQKVPGSVVFDLTARANLSFIKGASVALNIQNVLNRKYYTPGGPYDLNYLRSPQAPRALGLQLTRQF
jgi:outer membrane receptor for ferrienterochelin and colicins